MCSSDLAASRFGYKDFLNALRNAVGGDKKLNPNGTGVLDGKVIARVPFKDKVDGGLDKYKKPDNFMVHNADGSVDVIELKNREVAEAMKGTYNDTDSAINHLNRLTSALASAHTRFNPKFGPYNFVRDAMTNAGIMALEDGPFAGYQYLKGLTTEVAKGNLRKAWKVGMLYEGNTPEGRAKLEQLAKTDPFIRNMVDALNYGAVTTYREGMSLKANLDKDRKSTRLNSSH